MVDVLQALSVALPHAQTDLKQPPAAAAAIAADLCHAPFARTNRATAQTPTRMARTNAPQPQTLLQPGAAYSCVAALERAAAPAAAPRRGLELTSR